MAKTEETLIIEDVLYQNLFGSNPCLAREYGTKEVTVTLLKEKKVKEIVDFLSYNAKKSPTQGLLLVVAGTGFEPATPRV
jgi:hypothetical protein